VRLFSYCDDGVEDLTGFGNPVRSVDDVCRQTASLAPIAAETPETKKASGFYFKKATGGSFF